MDSIITPEMRQRSRALMYSTVSQVTSRDPKQLEAMVVKLELEAYNQFHSNKVRGSCRGGAAGATLALPMLRPLVAARAAGAASPPPGASMQAKYEEHIYRKVEKAKQLINAQAQGERPRPRAGRARCAAMLAAARSPSEPPVRSQAGRTSSSSSSWVASSSSSTCLTSR
jgi:hypothetical protein